MRMHAARLHVDAFRMSFAVRTPSVPLANPALFAAIGALAALATWPVLRAGFIGDDWGLLALVRHLDSPLSLYFYDHSSSYFYRPNAMLAWWASAVAFGVEPRWHYALNIALHAGNAMLLAALVLRGSGRRVAALFAGALFALHPTTSGAALWLADRFDLLATAAVLWALLATLRAIDGDGRRLWIFVAALLAAGCKETAVVLPPVVAAVLLLAPERSWRWRGATLALAAAPFVLSLLARDRILQDVATTLVIGDLAAALVAGVQRWLMLAPLAFAGTTAPLGGAAVAALPLLALLALAVSGLRGAPRPLLRLAAAGAGLALLPGLVQAPVTGLVLLEPVALENPANARFYYLALAGFAALLAAGLPGHRVGVRAAAVAFAACLGIALAWLPIARDRADGWVAISAGTLREVAEAAARTARNLDLQPGCTLYFLDTADSTTEFGGFSDVATKALLPRTAPALRCAVLTERAPWYVLVRESPCSDERWLPLTPRFNGPRELTTRPIGPLCFHYFADPRPQQAAAEAGARHFRWRAGEFVEIPAPPPAR